MLLHTGCGGNIFPVQRIEIRCGSTLTPRGLSIAGMGKISRLGGVGSTELSCDHCQRANIPASEISAICMECGVIFPLDQLVVMDEMGGIYCLEHAREFFPEYDQTNAMTALNRTLQSTNR